MAGQGFSRMAKMLACHALDQIAQHGTTCQLLGNHDTKAGRHSIGRLVMKHEVAPPYGLPESKNG